MPDGLVKSQTNHGPPAANTMKETATIERFFVCIGAQKAGTTWLARMLARHPDIFMTPVKEIHYFDHLQGLAQHLGDRKRRSRYRKYHQRHWTQPHRWREYAAQRDWYRDYMGSPIGDDWYRALFRARQGRAFAGEATPEYALIGREGFAHLKRLAPEARLLYIVRNPVERAWSQLLHQCRKTRTDAARLTHDELVAITGTSEFRAHGDYGAVLGELGAVFPEDQIGIEFYEDIHADRAAALARICGFIGLPDAPISGLARRYNPSQRAAIPPGFREHLRRQYEGIAGEIARRQGRLPQDWRDEFARAPDGTTI